MGWKIVTPQRSSDFKSIRNGLGVNQTGMGALLGVHTVTVSKWERGIARPTKFQHALLDVYAAAVRAETWFNVDRALTSDGVPFTMERLLRIGLEQIDREKTNERF